ncbi:MAG: hypothetical protein JOZ15_09030, partial [Acidobacteria bacterium]|nr:hypothetical protein [Acidobacteriota bacterium]
MPLLLIAALAFAGCGQRPGNPSGGQATAPPAPEAGSAAATPVPTAEGAAGRPRRGGTIVTGWTAEPNGVNELIVPATSVGQ